jgi:hypothetical protein
VGVLSLSIGLLRKTLSTFAHCPLSADLFWWSSLFLVWVLKVQHGPGWRRPLGGRAEDRRTKVRVLPLAFCSVDMVLERDEKDF